MQVVYGSSLPPSLDASTKGELRIRVEKMILDDDAINRNPLVRFFDEPGAPAQPASPNRFVVPVDYCAVSPLFWGETHPSAQCQPATPQQQQRGSGASAGVTTLVYPLKVHEEVFSEYLINMSRSPHHGLQIDVFVPSSYSGRPAVPVGKAILALDELRPGKPLSGWFTVAHYRRIDAAASRRRQYAREANNDDDDSGDDDDDGDRGLVGGDGPAFIPIGKLKLNIQMNFFASTSTSQQQQQQHNRLAKPNKRTSSASSGGGDKDGRRDGSGLNSSKFKDFLDESIDMGNARGGVDAGNSATRSPKASPVFGNGVSRSEGAPSLSLPSQSTIRIGSVGAPSDIDGQPSQKIPGSIPTSVIAGSGGVNELIKRGMELREKMVKAAAATSVGAWGSVETALEAPPFPPSDVATEQPRQSSLAAVCAGASASSVALAAAAVRGSRGGVAGISPFVIGQTAAEGGYDAGEEEDMVLQDADVKGGVGDEEEEERFAMELLNDTSGRNSRDHINKASGSHREIPFAADAEPNHTRDSAHSRRRNDETSLRDPAADVTTVELHFSNISFATTDATRDLEEMRINVRLSSDITTEEPSAGPFSSYVHHVPLAQSSICLSFSVRSFSEDASRLVVELFKVKSRAKVVPGSLLLPAGPNAPREVVSEELLGLCIVGLFKQSREIVLRDPVADVNNVRARLSIRLALRNSEGRRWRDGGSSGAEERSRSRHRRGDAHQSHGRNRGSQQEEPTTAGTTSNSSSVGSGSASARSGGTDASSGSERSAAGVRFASHQHHQHRHATSSGRGERSSAAMTTAETGATPPPGAYEMAGPALASAALSKALAKVASTASPSQGAPTHRQTTGSSGETGKNTATTATCTDPSFAAAPLLTASSGDRVRFHISIVSARQLPRIKMRVGNQPNLASHRPLSDSEKIQFVSPNSFFVVEEIFSGVDGRAANTAPVSEWVIEASVGGVFDRTNVVPQTQCPSYNYECIVSMPRESVFLQQADIEYGAPTEKAQHPRYSQQREQLNGSSRSNGSGSSRQMVSKPCLREVQFTLWHLAQPGDAEYEEHAPGESKEMHFWANTAFLGQCRVDLRPLRFLSRLDGYYKIMHADPEQDSESKMPSSVATSRSTIGYVRVAVSLL